MNNNAEHPDKIVLVTRPKEDAASLLEILDGRGYAALSSPLLSINNITPPESFSDWLEESQALVMTSANGVRALLAQEKYKHTYIRLPVYAVGDATAREAEKAGFKHVETAAGDVDKLADLIHEKLKPENGPVLHIAGSKLAGDLSSMLVNHGFTYHRATLYESIKATDLSIDVIEVLAHARVHTVLFYSPRTAESFSALVEKANLSETLKTVTALCLSPNVAKKISQHDWQDIQVAEKPTQNDLLTLLDALMTDTPSNADQEQENTYSNLLEDFTAEEIIDGFGGIRPMAGKVGVAVSTVQGWKSRNHIPDSHKDQIIKAASDEKVIFTKSDKPVEEKETTVIEGEVLEKSNEATETSDTEETTATEAEPVIIKKQVSTFSLIGIAALAGAMVMQPYWSPAVEKALNPIMSNFAPNLAAVKNDNAVEVKVNAAIAPLQERIEQLQTALSTSIQTANSTNLTEDKVLKMIGSELAILATAVTDLQNQVDAMPIITETADGTSIDLSPIHQSLEALDDRIDELQNLQGNGEIHFEKQLYELETEIKNIASPTITSTPSQMVNQESVALLVGVMEMSNALSKGRPIDSYITALKAQTGENSQILNNLDALENLAIQGLPTLYQLQTAYSAVAANPIAHRTDADEAEWVDATLNNLQNLISIRRVGEDETAPPISRAEAALNRGDLSNAITILTTLENERQDVREWLTEARKLDQAETYLAQIRQAASQAILQTSNAAENAQ